MTGHRSFTVVMGAPRSGTTWLSKIFDSHPDVLYRHEPDLVRIHNDVPHICVDGDEDRHVAVTREYFLGLANLRSLKTTGSLPVFHKSYEPAALRLFRLGALGGLRAMLTVLPGRTVNRIPAPEFIGGSQRGKLHLVMKTVASLGRAGLLARALPEARIVLILRNPFGQIASRLRGEAQRRLERRPRDRELLLTRQARDFGLTPAILESCSDTEYLAWEWAVLGQKAIDELAGLEHVHILRHSDLVGDPLRQARAIFDFAGLDWREETVDFIARSSSHNGPDRYFQVMRDGKKVLHRWRDDLDETQQEQITAVVRNTPIARRWPELFGQTQQAHAVA